MVTTSSKSEQCVGNDAERYRDIARRVRLDILEITLRPGGHVSSCFSAVEIMVALYFGGIVRYRPEQPHWSERDRVILSKGHAAPGFYTILAHAGYFPISELSKFRMLDTGFHGHPVQDALPGVEFTSGSLGQGLSFGFGQALAARLSKLDYRVYVIMGDGECQEGQVWEAAMAAAHFKTANLVAIVDHNKYQQTGPISREMSFTPFAEKWQSFGWHVEEADGHDVMDLLRALRALQQVNDKPSIIIAHTVKGKGVSFVEKDYTFHGKALNKEQLEKAREEILCH
ncbi:MAG: transketolase [Anaerolineae bacterium]|nr:transketolase [Anaerolineae bacterium]